MSRASFRLLWALRILALGVIALSLAAPLFREETAWGLWPATYLPPAWRWALALLAAGLALFGRPHPHRLAARHPIRLAVDAAGDRAAVGHPVLSVPHPASALGRRLHPDPRHPASPGAADLHLASAARSLSPCQSLGAGQSTVRLARPHAGLLAHQRGRRGDLRLAAAGAGALAGAGSHGAFPAGRIGRQPGADAAFLRLHRELHADDRRRPDHHLAGAARTARRDRADLARDRAGADPRVPPVHDHPGAEPALSRVADPPHRWVGTRRFPACAPKHPTRACCSRSRSPICWSSSASSRS